MPKKATTTRVKRSDFTDKEWEARVKEQRKGINQATAPATRTTRRLR